MKKHLLLLVFIGGIKLGVNSQNIVPNPSFETVTAEPFYGCEITNATGWLNADAAFVCPSTGGTPDLFSTFSTGQAQLPNTFMGTLNAHTGDRVAAVVTYHQQLTNYREYVYCALNCRLDSGVTYNVSFWTTGGNPVQYIYHSNNIGIYFSTGAPSQTGYNLIPGITPQIELTTVVANSVWTFYTFTFTPQQQYSYMTIGNFRDDASTQVQNFGTNRPYAYYFFDDFSVSPVNATASLPNDTSYCGNFTQTLSTGNPNTLWSTGVTASQITVNTAGTYWASTSGSCGNVSDTIVISGNSPPPPVLLPNDTSYCGSFSQTLSTGNSNTLWSTGVTAAQITITTTGTYWAQNSNACGTTTDTMVISQSSSFNLNLGNDTSLCIGQTLTLDATTPSGTYQWSDASAAATLNVSTAGTYAVTVSNGTGCTATDNIIVSYTFTPPVVQLPNDTAYCGNFSQTLSTANANTLWSTGAIAAQITVSSAGLYWAELSNGCGANRDSVLIAQLTLPLVNLGADTTICFNQSVVLSSPSSTGTLLWNDGSTGTTLVANTAGTYWLQVSQNGCRATDSIVVGTGIGPVFSLGADTVVCGKELLLAPNISGAQYLWQDNSTDSVYHLTSNGIYSVTVSNSCGNSTDEIKVWVHADECELHIPTGFSPNHDGVNDLFRAISYCSVPKFDLHVYNRWGELVFETTDIESGWNGNFRNAPQPMDVFAYYASYYNECEGVEKHVAGNVSLIR